MPTGRLFSLWPALVFFACASNGRLSAPGSLMVVAGDELQECTELLRGVMLANNDLESAGDIADVRAAASEKICRLRVESAEARANQNEFLAKWGLPLGGLGGATVSAVIAALLFTFVGR